MILWCYNGGMEMEQARQLVGEVFGALGLAASVTGILLTLLAWGLYWWEVRQPHKSTQRPRSHHPGRR